MRGSGEVEFRNRLFIFLLFYHLEIYLYSIINLHQATQNTALLAMTDPYQKNR